MSSAESEAGGDLKLLFDSHSTISSITPLVLDKLAENDSGSSCLTPDSTLAKTGTSGHDSACKDLGHQTTIINWHTSARSGSGTADGCWVEENPLYYDHSYWRNWSSITPDWDEGVMGNQNTHNSGGKQDKQGKKGGGPPKESGLVERHTGSRLSLRGLGIGGKDRKRKESGGAGTGGDAPPPKENGENFFCDFFF